MSTGRVTYYDDAKGFGFIRPDEGGADIFVHARSLIGTSALTIAQAVEFDQVFDNARGKYRAAEVRVL